ncbi:hypothetical protein QBC40DRAFT_329525, partial [Triangularia verruculosa]
SGRRKKATDQQKDTEKQPKPPGWSIFYSNLPFKCIQYPRHEMVERDFGRYDDLFGHFEQHHPGVDPPPFHSFDTRVPNTGNYHPANFQQQNTPQGQLGPGPLPLVPQSQIPRQPQLFDQPRVPPQAQYLSLSGQTQVYAHAYQPQPGHPVQQGQPQPVPQPQDSQQQPGYQRGYQPQHGQQQQPQYQQQQGYQAPYDQQQPGYAHHGQRQPGFQLQYGQQQPGYQSQHGQPQQSSGYRSPFQYGQADPGLASLRPRM